MRKFKNRLVVSCQDHEDIMIPAAINGGAGGIRLDTTRHIKAVRKIDESLPIIACWKKEIMSVRTRITPTIDLAVSLAEGGADYVAFDATNRNRLHTVPQVISAIHGSGAKVVADVSDALEGIKAWESGADIIATTLFPAIDLNAITSMANRGILVMAEGWIFTPEQARLCVEAGAERVCVGTAITRPQIITKRFVEVLT